LDFGGEVLLHVTVTCLSLPEKSQIFNYFDARKTASVSKGNEKKKAELEASMSKSAERIVSLKVSSADQLQGVLFQSCSACLETPMRTIVSSDAVHADHRLAQQLNDILQS